MRADTRSRATTSNPRNSACDGLLCATMGVTCGTPFACPKPRAGAQGGGKSAAEDDDGGARRAEMVGRLVAIARAAGLADENVHDAVMLLDRLLRLGLSREAASPAVLAGVAVLSTKQGAPSCGPWATQGPTAQL